MKTSNPVWDAEQATWDVRPVVGVCCMCGNEIRDENATYYGDDYYEFGNDKVCEKCIDDYVMDHCHRA